VASQQNANRYAYVGGDPINAVDPTGLCLIDVACGEQKKAWKNLKWSAKQTLTESAGCLSGAYAGLEYGAAVLEPEIGAGVGCVIGATAAHYEVDITEPSRTGQP
jgi:uncharacterized membrane protein